MGDGNHSDPTGVHRDSPSNTRVNQALLALPHDLFEHITHAQLKAIKLAQLQYSRDISTAAATAYQTIMTIIDV